MRRRIRDLCGFEHLSREEKVSRANEILNSTELKQSICNQILGTTFKDVERAMVSILDERQLTEEQQEEIELKTIAPEKFEPGFDAELEFRINKAAADPKDKIDYPTFSKETAQRLIREHFEYQEKEKKRKAALK